METEIVGLILGTVLPLYPLLSSSTRGSAGTTKWSRSSRNSGTSTSTGRRRIMAAETAPVATVTGLYRGTFSGLEPLTKDTPLTHR